MKAFVTGGAGQIGSTVIDMRFGILPRSLALRESAVLVGGEAVSTIARRSLSDPILG
jgi:hypothetical protein